MDALVTTSADKTIKVWNTSDWSLTRTLAHHQRWVWDAAFTCDGALLLSTSSDHTVKVWNMADGSLMRTLNGHNLTVTCVAVHDYLTT